MNRTLDGSHLLVLLAIAAVSVIGFLVIPPGTSLPVHWNFTGDVDLYMSREPAMLMIPGIAALLAVMVLWMPRLAGREQFEAGRHVLGRVTTAITALLLAVQTGIVAIGAGISVDMVRIIAIGMALLLIIIGNALPKSQPNGFAGIRLPWTLRDPANWQATHRFAGRAFVAAGIALNICSVLFHDPRWLIGLVLAAYVLPVAGATLYSFRQSRRPA